MTIRCNALSSIWDNLKTFENELYNRKYYCVNVRFTRYINWVIVMEENTLIMKICVDILTVKYKMFTTYF